MFQLKIILWLNSFNEKYATVNDTYQFCSYQNNNLIKINAKGIKFIDSNVSDFLHVFLIEPEVLYISFLLGNM